MPQIERSALVEHPAERVLESSDQRMLARLDLGIGAVHTWFSTENRLHRPERIEMELHDGPFRHLLGIWRFQPLSGSACKVSLTLDFEPTNRLLAPVLGLGLRRLADQMVDDFVRVADQAAA